VDVGDTVSLRVTTAAGPTEVVGVVESRTPDVLVVRRRDGQVVEVGIALISASRVVPPGPARAIGTTELEAIAAAGWRALEVARLGEWLRRASGGFTARANSALAVGDPGMPLADAVDGVESWYAERSLPPRIQLVSGDDRLTELLDRRGWSGGGDDDVLTAEIAHVLRPLRGREEPRIRVDERPDDAWLAAYRTSSGSLPAVAVQLLTNHPAVAFLSVRTADDSCDAIARVVVDGRWAGLFAVEVSPRVRRCGLGRAVSAAALRWAAGAGARHAYLQVAAGNDAAHSLYESLGFAVHHQYQHWLRPSSLR
jgi:ribosomal protein S18 acetylase RimI-like enzyme